jgi:hypothetical protein
MIERRIEAQTGDHTSGVTHPIKPLKGRRRAVTDDD